MKKTIAVAMAAACSLALTSTAFAAGQEKQMPAGMEKCAPTKHMVKEGKGNCMSGKNSCAGQNKKMEAGAWIMVPTGTCAHINNDHWSEVPKDICAKLEGVDEANCKS